MKFKILLWFKDNFIYIIFDFFLFIYANMTNTNRNHNDAPNRNTSTGPNLNRNVRAWKRKHKNDLGKILRSYNTPVNFR